MPGIYVDTSALGRVVLGEADGGVIRTTLARFDPWHASELLVVELRRLGRREGVQAAVEQLVVLTYDHQLQAGCQHHGIAVEAPVV